MPGLYANRSLQENLNKLGVVDRFPRLGGWGLESVLTLAVFTSPDGYPQCVLSLELLADGGRVAMSHRLGVYPMSAQSEAYADALLVALKLKLDLRRCDPAKGWIVEGCDDGPEGEDLRLPGKG